MLICQTEEIKRSVKHFENFRFRDGRIASNREKDNLLEGGSGIQLGCEGSIFRNEFVLRAHMRAKIKGSGKLEFLVVFA